MKKTTNVLTFIHSGAIRFYRDRYSAFQDEPNRVQKLQYCGEAINAAIFTKL